MADFGQNEVLMNYSNYYLFDFEDEFDYFGKKKWIRQHWHNSFYYIGIYMLFIFAGKHYMQPREKFDLRKQLIVWNLSLAVFSTVGMLRTVPELSYVLFNYGFHSSVCNPEFVIQSKVSGFWGWMFILSKVPELGDTVFIVLRKQPLIFLHWYHHITVLLYCWYSNLNDNSSGMWFMVMNYAVHAFMYTYYALKAARFQIPKFVSMVITSLQLLQMVVGLVINIWCYSVKSRGDYCGIDDKNLNMAFTIYFSYFVLFAHFFYNAYIQKMKNLKMKKLK